jgi:hypothetical protein
LLATSESRTIKHFITSTIHPSTFPPPSTQNFKLQTSNSKLRSREAFNCSLHPKVEP